jgi:hypothetical protein
VNSQESLPATTAVAVLRGLGSAERIARALRMLEVALGFLHNSKIPREKLLCYYLRNDLMMAEQPDFENLVGKGPAKTVALKHVLALVEALDQHQAQDESASGRDIFSDQPEIYKLALEPPRAAELFERVALRGDGEYSTQFQPNFELERAYITRFDHMRPCDGRRSAGA